jgi:hypothetical protein
MTGDLRLVQTQSTSMFEHYRNYRRETEFYNLGFQSTFTPFFIVRKTIDTERETVVLKQ